jgi:hypothetical protein
MEMRLCKWLCLRQMTVILPVARGDAGIKLRPEVGQSKPVRVTRLIDPHPVTHSRPTSNV